MTRRILHEENSRTVLTVFSSPSGETSTFPQYLAAFFATLSAVAIGSCLSWTSSAIPMLQSGTEEPYISNEEGSWVGSLITLGACFGALPAGYLSNCLGRKRLLQMLAFPMIISWKLIAFGENVWAYYTARFLAGLAVGGISVAAPMYVAELAEAKIRGTLGTFFQLQITVGLLIGYILGGTVNDFTALALISSTLPALFLILFSFMPESPVFLINSGDIQEARNALQWFRGKDYDIEDDLRQIRDGILEANANRGKVSDFFNDVVTKKAMIISLGLMVFQQLSGINAVLFYAGKIFKETGGSMSPSVCAMLIGVVQVLATFASTLLIDRLGRKLLLIISASIMSFCLAGLSAYFYLKENVDLSNYSLVPVACVALFIIVFSIGFGPIPWMMIGELFSNKMKGRAGSISAAFNWTLAFTVTKSFQNMLNMFGNATTFGIFAAICVLGTVFVFSMVPETKGKDILEVQAILAGKELNRQVSSDSEGSDDFGVTIDLKKEAIV